MCQESDAPSPMVYIYIYNNNALFFLIYIFLILFTFFFFGYRLILAMDGIVINSPLTIPIVLKCGLRTGLVGMYCFLFCFFNVTCILLYIRDINKII
jgi:hypothetical protein